MAQTLDISGFIAGIEIEPDEYLLPLQEVIVNAIQSIEDKNDRETGIISIKVIRGKQLTLGNEMEQPYLPIEGFEIFDNGVGFINKRFAAFNKAFTRLNKAKGCKGIGRYTVAACFHSMDIESNFYEDDKWQKRTFSFNGEHDVVPEGGTLTAPSENKLLTHIKLNNYGKPFQDYINSQRVELEDLAKGIIEHCLLYFVSNQAPQIRLYNANDPQSSIFVNDLFRAVVKFDKEPKQINLDNIGKPFYLNYIRNYSNKSHAFHLCANKREVGSKMSISTYIPSFAQGIEDEENKKYYLSVYVTGDYLDEKANNQRNKFAIPLKVEDKKAFDPISIDELLNGASDNVRNQYSDWLVTASKEKTDRIHNYILNPEKPRLSYKHLLSVENVFDDIPANATDERLEAELHKKTFHLEQKRSKAFEKAFSKKKYDKAEFTSIIQNVLKEEAAFSYGKLADLMVRRKSVIKLFQKYIEWRDDKNYMLEEDLHNMIFTMGAESNTMPKDYHNLWLLDERLAFHSYTTSDRQLRSNKHIPNESKKETDLLIYDFPWAFTDNPSNINSLVVFEFKRPGRDMNTSKDKKLDAQVEEYFEELMKSNAKSVKGNFLNIQDNTPKFGYIVCDLHKDLIDHNIKHNYFKKTPYNTLFKINPELNQYFEVMSYQTMIDFAAKRHDAFFQALGIDNL